MCVGALPPQSWTWLLKSWIPANQITGIGGRFKSHFLVRWVKVTNWDWAAQTSCLYTLPQCPIRHWFFFQILDKGNWNIRANLINNWNAESWKMHPICHLLALQIKKWGNGQNVIVKNNESAHFMVP